MMIKEKLLENLSSTTRFILSTFSKALMWFSYSKIKFTYCGLKVSPLPAVLTKVLCLAKELLH